jgi:UDP:flavonoid glycosyltransferase YjiC (YdhE family)
MRVLFTAVPLCGHFFPLVPLAWACRSAGHDVLVATPENFVPSVLRAGLPAAPSGPGAVFVDLVPGEAARRGAARRRRAHGRAFGQIAAGSIAGTDSLVASWKPDLVVSDRAEFSGPLAAAGRDIPFAELHWGIPPLADLRAAAGRELGDHLAARGLDGLPEPAWVINPWPPSLWLPHAAGHQSMRHIPYNGDTRLPDWIRRPRPRPRICLTLGTVLPFITADKLPKIVFPLLRSLAGLGAELVVAVDDAVAATWGSLPDAVLHAGRMPLSDVFRVCDIAIHHGGNGTSLSALDAGLPQLVLPRFDDQFENGESVVRAGAGLSLPHDEISPGEVAAHAAELLGAEAFGVASARVAAEIAAQPSPADLVPMLADVAAGAGRRLAAG